MEMHFSGLLFSKRNIELGYQLKKIGRAQGISINNVDHISMLVYLLEHTMYDFLFVDCNSVQVDDQFEEFIRSPHIRGACEVIFIDGDRTLAMHHLTCIPSEELESAVCQMIGSGHKYKAILGKRVDNFAGMSTHVADYLISIGVTPKYTGFSYIKEIVLYSIITGDVHSTLSREVYPIIAARHRTTPESVERNIRNSIKVACDSDAFKENLSDLLGTRPTNRNFLSFLIDRAQSYYSCDLVGNI